MLRSLRVRLLMMILAGIGILAIINVFANTWLLFRVRDQAVNDSAAALQTQAGGYLERLAQERAYSVSQKLTSIQKIATATSEHLSQVLATPPTNTSWSFQSAPGGWRYHNAITTVVLPKELDDQQLEDLATSSGLDVLLPGLMSSIPEVTRISYLMPSGGFRTYPSLDATKLLEGWTVSDDISYKAALPENNPFRALAWTQAHTSLDASEQVISAVVPVYQTGRFAGAVVVDISLAKLTVYLQPFSVDETGFSFLLGSQDRFLALPSEGQIQLIGRFLGPEQQGHVSIDQSLPGLNAVLTDMHTGRRGNVVVDLRGEQYLLAYEPVSTLNWSLGVAAPLKDIAESTEATSASIVGIARNTQMLGMLAAVIAVTVLGTVMSVALRRWLVQPLMTLISATESIATGQPRHIDAVSSDEIGQLATSFNVMTTALQTSRAEITKANQELEAKVRERTFDLDMAVTELGKSFATQQNLLRALREVSTPVIPLMAGVLAMPLIGQIDAERAKNMTNTLLSRIEQERAHTVLLDITGVAVIDTWVAQALLQMVAASRLLGAEVVLVGVSPEVAQAIVALGINLRGLRSMVDLRSAVEKLLMVHRRTS